MLLLLLSPLLQTHHDTRSIDEITSAARLERRDILHIPSEDQFVQSRPNRVVVEQITATKMQLCHPLAEDSHGYCFVEFYILLWVLWLTEKLLRLCNRSAPKFFT